MKALSFLCVLGCVLLSTQSAQAYSSSHVIPSIIKSNQTARSKPTYTKYAAVSFLKSADTTVDFKGTLDVKSQCGALGYVMPVEKCTNKMNGKNQTGSYVHSRLCSEDPSMTGVEGASNYTTGCCDKRIYTVSETAECPNNAAKLSNDSCYWDGSKKYRCACDRGRYQYSTIEGEWCGVKQETGKVDYSRFNANLACAAYEPRTEKTEAYFISCCPSSYSVCNADNHEVGRGNECRVAENAIQLASLSFTPKYEECICAPHYDTECPSDKVINRNLVCEDKNNKIWTPESNCESDCSKTIETNIDSYLYKKIWHCLYRKDGAKIRDVEDEAGICGVFDYNNNEAPYDDCIAQGYNKREADCYNSSTILRCPNDLTKVWCLEGKYCTGYDVGSFHGINYCVEGANIEMCPSTDKGKRCQYKNDKCNCMWNDGEFDITSGNCYKYFASAEEAAAFATSTTINGDDQTCCNRGYKMQLGRCVKNICDRNLYPYNLRPGDEMGELEVCYEGDESAELGYKAYFGYTSCHDDASQGQKWIKEGEEGASARRCVCARDGQDGRVKLPYDLDTFFDMDQFFQGAYGDDVNCTDAEGSYYGYEACYIGSVMGKSGGVPTGKCTGIGDGGRGGQWTYVFGLRREYYHTYMVPTVNRILESAGLTKITQQSMSYPVTNRTADPTKVFCINPTQHCPNGNPEQCDESVKPLLVSGCIHGWETECSAKCYHISNLVQEDGIYKLNDKNVLLAINSWASGARKAAFEKCPKGFEHSKGSYNTCLRYCSVYTPGNCYFSDIVTTYTEAELFNADGSLKVTADTIDKNRIVGIVFARDGTLESKCGTSKKLHILSMKKADLPQSSSDPNVMTAFKYPTSDQFKAAVGETIYNLTSLGLPAGTAWRLPTQKELHSDCFKEFNQYSVNSHLYTFTNAVTGQLWSSSAGYYRNGQSTTGAPESSIFTVRPAFDISY